jgi:hypothetical protein
MNIKLALKEKNKQVKKNSENFHKLSTYNSVETGTDRAYDPKQALEDWKQGINDLIDLKAKIHRANAKVYEKIFRLAELKSVVKQLRNLDCTSGKQTSYRSTEPIFKDVIISLVERDSMVKDFENEIEKLQEELDAHNGKTKI